MQETKSFLTDMRNKFSSSVWNTSLYTDFERTYGKYLYVPFDVPKIQPNDMGEFIRFYFKNAKQAVKTIDDFVDTKEKANDVSPYYTITNSAGHNRHAAFWSGNDVPDIQTKFPEIFEQYYEYFPFVGSPNFRWTMWSSNKDIPYHRDYGMQIDAPITFRVMLFDTNPKQSLGFTLDPLDKQADLKYDIKLPNDSNSFVWNNLRQKHGSVYTQGHRKILMIISPFEVENIFKKQHMNSFIDLLERSIAKYKKETVIDTMTDAKNYLNIDIDNTHNIM